MVNAALDQRAAIARVVGRLVMLENVPPIARLVVHEVHTTRAADPRDDGRHAVTREKFALSVGQALREALQLLVHALPRVHELLETRDGGGNRDGMAVV